MRQMLRPALFLAVVAAPLFAAGTAAAQDAGTAAAFAADDFFIGVQYPAGHNLSDFDVARFFNKANCDCDTPVTVYVALTNSGFAKKASGADKSGNIEFWIGTNCVDPNLRDFRCKLLKSQTFSAFLNLGRDTSEVSARDLSTYTSTSTVDGGVTGGVLFKPNPTCTLPLETFNQTIWVLSNKTGTPTTLKTRDVYIDLTPPPAPNSDGILVQGGNQGIEISWPGVDSAITTDFLGYQVLCDRAGSLQVFNDGTFGAGYQECARAADGDGGIINGPTDGGVAAFDTRFACSPLLAPTSRSFRVKILQNDITYGVAVVAIDRSGNASIPDVFYAKPIKTKSFYDVYKNDDPDHPGAANGGLCTVSSGASVPGALAGLCAAALIVSVVLSRRGRRR